MANGECIWEKVLNGTMVNSTVEHITVRTRHTGGTRGLIEPTCAATRSYSTAAGGELPFVACAAPPPEACRRFPSVLQGRSCTVLLWSTFFWLNVCEIMVAYGSLGIGQIIRSLRFLILEQSGAGSIFTLTKISLLHLLEYIYPLLFLKYIRTGWVSKKCYLK